MRISSLTRVAAALLVGAMTSISAADKVFQETGGAVVVEAENFSVRTAGDPHQWQIIPTEDPGPDTFANARGGQYIQALPNSGVNNNLETTWSNRPWADYYVKINTPGTYRVYLRWNGYTGNNSMYGEIVELKDGTGGSIADWYRWGIPDTVTPFDDFDRGWDGSAGRELISGDSGDTPATWDLTPGVYTVRLHMREDGGAADAFALQLTSLAAPGNPGPAQSAEATSFVRITRQPANTAVSEGTAATFSVEASGSGTVTYQWQRAAPGSTTFTDVAGATSASYTTPILTSAETGAQYRVNVSVPGTTLASRAATVSLDQVPPAVVGALGGGDLTSVTIRFNERVTQATAETLANYTISGLTLSNPRLQANGTDVVLTTTTQTTNTPYTITINGIRDTAGNVANGLQARFSGATYIPGGVLHKFWSGITVNNLDALRSDPRFPNNPTMVTVEPRFEWPPNGGNEGGSTYGNMMTGWIAPPTTGDYVFYTCSDDPSDLYLSTDDKPANKKLIAQETIWSNARQWVTSGGASDLASKRSDQFAGSEWPTPNVITLTAGRLYYIEVQHTEGTGGDNVGVQWQRPGDPEPADGSAPIDGSFVRILVDPTAAITFTQQPTNVTVQASTPAAFTVRFNAFSAFGTNATVQWQRAPAGSTTFTDIPGATGGTFNIAFASPADNNAQFRAAVTASGTTVNSSAATLTVGSETSPPQLTGVSADTQKILVSFNEPLDAASVTSGAFTVAGATITGATVVSAAGQPGAVRLTATGLTAGQQYTLNVTGVRDLSGNAVAAGTSRTFTAFHISENFGSGVPAGAGLAGSATVLPTGELELTRNVGSLQGSLTFPDALNGGTANQFTATFKLFIGNGSGNAADGFSFSMASDLMTDPATPPNFSEEGGGSGLSVVFDTYDNGGGEAPAIGLKFAGTEFATTNLAKAVLVNNQWVDVVIKVDTDGTIDVQHNNVKYFDNVPVEGWTPITAPQITIGARTGGEWATHRVDDVNVLYNATIALPQPPTISITSPTPNQTFPANSAVTITVNATDPEGQIAKVEFFANGTKIGESTTAPYSFTVPSAPQGVYNVTARITDAQGLSVTSLPVKAIVGNPGKILFVHATGGPNTSDNLLADYLITRGYDPVMAPAGPSTTEDAAGKLAVVISSTVASGDVADKFRDVTTPVVGWENALQDNFLYTLDQDGTTRGVTGGQTALEIVTPSHPIAGGLSGTVTIADAGVEVSWGTPAGSAIPIARVADGTGHLAIYAFEPGAVLIDGTSTTAGRRVHIGGGDATYAGMNATGRQLWHNAINWAIGATTPSTNRPTATIARSGANITISSSDGGTVQASTSLAPASWTDLGPAPQTVSPTGAMRFFRIRK